MAANQRIVKYFKRKKLLTKTVYYSTQVLDQFTCIFFKMILIVFKSLLGLKISILIILIH